MDGGSGAIIKRGYDGLNAEVVIESKTLKNLCGMSIDLISSKNIFVYAF